MVLQAKRIEFPSGSIKCSIYLSKRKICIWDFRVNNPFKLKYLGLHDMLTVLMYSIGK